MNKRTAYFAPGIFCLILSVFFCGCQKDNKKPEVFASGLKENDIPTQQIWGMKVLQTDSDQVVQRMYAGYAKRSNPDFNQAYVTDFDSGFTVIFYKKGHTYGRLDSRKGIMDDYKNVWTAIDSVVLKSPAGYTIYTDRLTWNKNDKRLFSESPVMYVKGIDTLRGDGFVSDENMVEYNIVNPRGKAFLADEKLKGAKEK